ncbi:MAG: diaminopimelate epimerase [Bacteroidota bacterium]
MNEKRVIETITAEFHKYHALGNDYLVIDPQRTRLALNEQNIKLICHRNFGLGSDGILWGPFFEGDRISLRILNPDGSEAEKSGNGIRIFARYLMEAGYVTGDGFSLRTLGGDVAVEILDRRARMVRVDMGTVTFWSDRIPVGGERREVVDEALTVGEECYRVTCVSLGNPHCVIPVADISRDLAARIGPLIERHPSFPRRINMQLLRVLDRNNIQIEIWERGAGYTLASGSSSCAAASAAFRLGLVDDRVTVHMPGGKIEVQIKTDGHVLMTGPVVGVARGEFSPDLLTLCV